MSKSEQVVDVDDEDEFEVEKILDKRMDKKGVMYLVKWEGFPEDQATWEPADHLENVKWLVDEFNGRRKRKSPSDSEAPKKHPVVKSPQDTKETEASDSEPAVSIPPELLQETPTKWRGPPRVKGKKDAKPPAKTAVSSASVMGVRAARGSLTLDVAVKILGCRRHGQAIEYAVQFKRRSDTGVVVLPQVCTHDELKLQAPWLLSQYLLDSAKVDDSN